MSSARSFKRRKYDIDDNDVNGASGLTDSIRNKSFADSDNKEDDNGYDSAVPPQALENREERQTLNFASYQQMSSSILKQYSCTPLQPISQSPAEEAAAGPPGPG